MKHNLLGYFFIFVLQQEHRVLLTRNVNKIAALNLTFDGKRG